MKKALHIVIYIFAAIGFVLVIGYTAIKLGWTKTSGFIDLQHGYFKDQAGLAQNPNWSQGEEWQTLKAAIRKDASVINMAATATGVSPRLLVSILIVEQLRLFHSEREIFKQVFAPLQILGTQSQFSWGVMGIKQDTAIMIENNLTATSSPFYLGKSFEHILDYPATTTSLSEDAQGITITTDKNAARFARLTNEHDRSYSYLYAAFYVRQIVAQWGKSGIDISERPDIIATLFNIGFGNSKPHPDPLPGGAEIRIGSETYSFGSLAGSFYQSEELTQEFPR